MLLLLGNGAFGGSGDASEHRTGVGDLSDAKQQQHDESGGDERQQCGMGRYDE